MKLLGIFVGIIFVSSLFGLTGCTGVSMDNEPAENVTGGLIDVGAPGDILFQEDFSGGMGTWEIGNGNPSDLSVIGEELVYVGTESSVSAYNGDTGWTNYTFECRFMSATEFNDDCTFAVRATTLDPGTSPDLNSEYMIRISGTQVRFFDYPDVGEAVIASASFNINTWYNLKITAIGSSIKVEVDDVEYVYYYDDTNPHTAGRIAVRAESNWPVGSLNVPHFDDIVVRESSASVDDM